MKLWDSSEKCHVLVRSVLKALPEVQVLALNELGIMAVAIGKSQKTDDEILEEKMVIVFVIQSRSSFHGTHCLSLFFMPMNRINL